MYEEQPENCTMERDEGLKFMYQLLTMMMQKKGSDLFITAGFPAGDQDRRQDDAGHHPAAVAAAHAGTGARDHE
jgi:hypothetical protein